MGVVMIDLGMSRFESRCDDLDIVFLFFLLTVDIYQTYFEDWASVLHAWDVPRDRGRNSGARKTGKSNPSQGFCCVLLQYPRGHDYP